MIRLLLILVFMASTGCSHHSKGAKPYRESVINAPIDIVWEKTLRVLRAEGVTLKTVSKIDYFISGRQSSTLRSWLGNDIDVRLTAEREKQTFVYIEVRSRFRWFDLGDEEVTLGDILSKIRRASENPVQPEPQSSPTKPHHATQTEQKNPPWPWTLSVPLG